MTQSANSGDMGPLLRKLAREQAARQEAEMLLESKSRELYVANQALQEANQSLDSARQKAEQASKAKSVFIANVSHELLTPMNAIIGLSQLLADTALSSKQREYLATIAHSAEHLLSILRDMLDLSSIDAGTLQLTPSHFRIDELIDEVALQIVPLARAKGLELIVDTAAIAHISLSADRERLLQALHTLLHNAVKFTVCGHVLVGASVLRRGDGVPQLDIAVSDTGIGMSDEAQARLFQPFVQADQSPGRVYGGAGLGLAILRQLAGLMGGDIRLSHSSSLGSAFVLSIPAIALTSANVVPAFVCQEARALEGMRLLLVDATAAARQAQAALLQRHGFAVDTLASAEQALQRLREASEIGTPYAAVLVASPLGADDGLALLHTICQLDLQPAPRLVCLTPRSRQELQAEAAGAGCELVLEKPLLEQGVATELLRYLCEGQLPPAPDVSLHTAPQTVAAVDVALLRALLNDGDVGVLEWVEHNEAALRGHLAGDYLRFVTALRNYDFDAALALVVPLQEETH